ncbi:MAG: hypothetical protein HC896_03550 [Bacteroidales bacterium]|nr:hypothetical protein [Bacteroidales bacterium]
MAKLYGAAKPRRMSLPAYPFAKEKYWWNDTLEDGKLTLNQLIDKRLAAMVIHPLLHVNTSNLGQQSYSTTFTGEELFLKEYPATGQKTLPPAAYIEMANAAVKHALPVKPEPFMVEFQDTIFGQPVLINGATEVNIILFARDNEHIDFEIYSKQAGEETVHCQGHAHIYQQPAPNKLDLAYIKNKPGKHQLLFEIEIPGIVGHHLNGYSVHPVLLDNAFQAATNIFTSSNASVLFPSALEIARIVAACKENMIAWVRHSSITKTEDKETKLDIDLCDEQGNICVQLAGVSYFQAPSVLLENQMEWWRLLQLLCPGKYPLIPDHIRQMKILT